MAVQLGRQELPPALRAQRVALVAAARAALAAEKEAALTGAAPTDWRPAVAAAPVRAGVRASVNGAGRPEQGSRTSVGVHTDRPARAGVLRNADPSTPARTTSRRGRGRPAEIQERVEFIARTHGQLSVAQQAEQLGVSYALVSKHRQELARAGRIEIRHRLSDHREWTDAEDAFLRENVGRLSFEQLGARLKRSAIACTVRVKRDLRLDRTVRKANRETLNASDVARILGQDMHFVERQLIAWGLLKAKKHEWLATNSAMQWAIRREDLVDFLLDYPWQYDRERITDPFFRRAADEAWNRDPLYSSDEAAALLGLKGGKSFVHLVLKTLPKFMERRFLVLRRRGRPGAKGKSLGGQHVFVHRSTLRAIQRSGWQNYRAVADDPNRLTVDRAAKLLLQEPDYPAYLTNGALRTRLRRLYDAGAIPTTTVRPTPSRIWKMATPQDVRAMKPALFARNSHVLRINATRRGLLERHDPGLLADPRALALALADGHLLHDFRVWMDDERQARRELAVLRAKKVAFVTRHVARVLETLNPRTKYRAPRRIATYHLLRHAEQLVAIPLREAKAHALHLCGWCEFTRMERRRRPEPTPFLLVCVDCAQRFPRGRGRPARSPRCSSCREHDRRAA